MPELAGKEKERVWPVARFVVKLAWRLLGANPVGESQAIRSGFLSVAPGSSVRISVVLPSGSGYPLVEDLDLLIAALAGQIEAVRRRRVLGFAGNEDTIADAAGSGQVNLEIGPPVDRDRGQGGGRNLHVNDLATDDIDHTRLLGHVCAAHDHLRIEQVNVLAVEEDLGRLPLVDDVDPVVSGQLGDEALTPSSKRSHPLAVFSKGS